MNGTRDLVGDPAEGKSQHEEGYIWLKYIICVYENSLIKPTKSCKIVRQGDKKVMEGVKSDQSTLCSCMEIS
jgi:hypothetical protein